MGIFEKLFKQKGQRWIAKLIIRRWGASAALPRKLSTPLEGDQIWTAFSVAVKLEPSKTRNQSKNRPKNRSRGPRRKKLRKKEVQNGQTQTDAGKDSRNDAAKYKQRNT